MLKNHCCGCVEVRMKFSDFFLCHMSVVLSAKQSKNQNPKKFKIQNFKNQNLMLLFACLSAINRNGW